MPDRTGVSAAKVCARCAYSIAVFLSFSARPATGAHDRHKPLALKRNSSGTVMCRTWRGAACGNRRVANMKRNAVQQQAPARKARPLSESETETGCICSATKPRDQDSARRSCYHPARKGRNGNGQTSGEIRVPQIDVPKVHQTSNAADRSARFFADRRSAAAQTAEPGTYCRLDDR